ncbi:Phospholipid scramblase 2 [Daphnia magna]|uniref:Phospholipid scramblase n=1 Tax=Daphnia magna TaxID=35525 RepID=A0A164K3H3_9CRUS|nr:Phospholipid scramblase 2 [Daphnia magna]
MYAPNAPPNGGNLPAPGAPPPPYSEQGVSYPPPALGQPQQTGYGGYPPPVIGQPEIGFAGALEWMPLQPQHQQNRSCPPGLEYLTAVDQLLVHQKVELLEAFVGFETSNKYTVKNSMGQKVFYAAEMSDCCTRQCCGPNRPFDMKIVDNHGQETMEVTAPPGTPIGSIQQEWSILSPKFSIKDASGETVLTIEGPICTFSICGDVEFNVYSRNGDTKVGKISKQWSGLIREAFTDADMFGINFPLDLDVRTKAVLLGACFLIDFMFFEKAGNNERDRPGML